MTRHSTRLKSAPQVTPVDLPSDDDDDDDEFVDAEVTVEVAEKNPRGKKRKTYDNSKKVDGRPHAKKARHVRGKRGLLKQLVEMPVDVLFEIFGSLEPLDLLHLARTSKDLRALLMTPSSISTWKQSLGNIPGLPECPDDLTEPQYAELVFGKSCNVCDKNSGTIQTMWGSRLRACNKCFESDERFREINTYRPYGSELLALLPSVEVSRKSGRHNRARHIVDALLEKSWSSEYASLESSSAKQEWVANKIREMKLIHAHAAACSAWREDVHRRREADKQTVINNRKAIVLERLKELGWGEELNQRADSAGPPENHPLVSKACQKELTEKVLSSLEEPLVQFMEGLKSQRLLKERRAFLRERLIVLNLVRETCVSTLPANAICPTTAELFRIPFVRNLIDTAPATGDFTQDDLEPVSLAFNDLNHQWQKDIGLKLLDIIGQAKGSEVEDSLDAEVVLSLATTFFSCKGCGRFLRYPAVLVHSCATKYNYQAPDTGDLDNAVVGEVRQEIFWNTNHNIFMKMENVAIVAHLLDMVGLDSKTTTAQEMDILNPIFECISCNGLSEGRAVMSWQTAVVHRSQRHSLDTTVEMVLLDEAEAKVLHPRMVEQVDRERHQAYQDFMICMLCKKTGKALNLRAHIRKDHGKPNPADDDVVLKIDADPIPKIYRHWPPREEEVEPMAIV